MVIYRRQYQAITILTMTWKRPMKKLHSQSWESFKPVYIDLSWKPTSWRRRRQTKRCLDHTFIYSSSNMPLCKILSTQALLLVILHWFYFFKRIIKLLISNHNDSDEYEEEHVCKKKFAAYVNYANVNSEIVFTTMIRIVTMIAMNIKDGECRCKKVAPYVTDSHQVPASRYYIFGIKIHRHRQYHCYND